MHRLREFDGWVTSMAHDAFGLCALQPQRVWIHDCLRSKSTALSACLRTPYAPDIGASFTAGCDPADRCLTLRVSFISGAASCTKSRPSQRLPAPHPAFGHLLPACGEKEKTSSASSPGKREARTRDDARHASPKSPGCGLRPYPGYQKAVRRRTFVGRISRRRHAPASRVRRLRYLHGA
jgi:hypothetical protein